MFPGVRAALPLPGPTGADMPRQVTGGESEPSWVADLRKWETADYDGIKGWTPVWVPQPHREKFRLARTVVFFAIEDDQATYDEIRSRFDYLVADVKHRMVLALLKDRKPYDEQLHFLVDLFKAASLDEIEGL